MTARDEGTSERPAPGGASPHPAVVDSATSPDPELTRIDTGVSEPGREHLSGESLPALSRKALLGRYSLLRKLGEGGMGVVYFAYDEELDRRVAIKLLRVQSDGDTSAAPRMLREAQLMAKLSHPNVVQVYDVGVVSRRVFLAMEFVQGTTLREWIHGTPEQPRPAPRPWPEVLAMYIQAGHGLAAAHAAGLVHRDFKPDNVLVGVDGRARVLDFGLARSDAHHDDLYADSEASGEPLLQSHPSRISRRSTEPPLTVAGTLIGTPAYMSPEQHLRAATDARSDQFSFCVSLYEGIYGERPFVGRTTSDLRASALTGKIRDPPPGRKIPTWLRKVLLRGLRVLAADRFPDMPALLAALAADPGRARRRWLVGAGVVALAGAVGLGVAVHRSHEVAICRAADRLLVGVWDEPRALAVQHALTATGLAYARDTWPRVHEHLDLYARTWQSMHVDVCEATNVHRTQSPALMDLRMTCLAESLAELRAVVDLLAAADVQVAERAVQVATGMRPLTRCADPALTVGHAGLTVAAAAEVRELDTLLVQVRAEHVAGRYTRGLQLAREAVVAADRIGHDPARAEALRHRGMLEAGAADFAAAERSYEAAYLLAEAIGDDVVRLEAAVALVELVGERRGRDHDSAQWAGQAEALLRRLGDPPDLEATLRANLGVVHTRYARYDQALTALTRAIDLGDAPGDPRRANNQRLLGNVYYRKGQYADAEVAYARAVELAEAALGPGHPDLARSLSNLGEAHRVQGHDDEAERCFRRSIEIWERAFGPEHPLLAPPYNGLGTIALLRGDTGAAVAHFELVRRLLERSQGPDHPDVGAVTSNLGEVLLVDGSLAESRRHSERALQILEKALGREHDGLADVLCNIARALVLQGELTAAAEHYARAVTLLERSQGPDFVGLAKPLTGQGLLALAAGRPADAVAPLERALALGVADPGKLAELRLALARALWDAGQDRPRAHALATRARADLTSARPGPLHTRLADELTRWLAEHPLP